LPAQEEVVRRLRELYEATDDEDRPRAALLAGLAVADLVALLPDGDPRLGELAAEGLALLAGSADASPATRAASERLHEHLLEAAAGAPNPEPESLSLSGGDLNWDLDWEALRGPSEAAKNVIGMLPAMASMLPLGLPLRQALTNITDVLGAFEQGQWTPERDASLKQAIKHVEEGGLGTGLGSILRLIAMMIRVRRCQRVHEEGGEPNWPSLAEFDALIADMESAQDLAAPMGAPFQAMDGLHHMYIAIAIMMRLLVSVRSREVRRDASWRDDTLRLLERADERLRQAPSAHAGVVRTLRGKIAEATAALSRAVVPPAPPRTAAPAPAPAQAEAEAHEPPSAAAPRSASFPPAAEAGTGSIWSWSFDPAIIQHAQRLLAGLPILVGQTEGSTSNAMAGMLLAMEAVNSRKWTSGYDERLAELERRAADADAQGGTLRERAMSTAMLAVTHAVRCQQRSVSPHAAEHPSASQFAAVIAESESALELLTQVTGEVKPLVDGLSAMVRAQTAMLLVDLSRLDQPHRADLLARARAHFEQLPGEMLEGMPLMRDLSVIEQLIEGRVQPDDEAVGSVIRRNPSGWDQRGGDLKRALAAADKAGLSRAPDDIGAALRHLQTVWIGLPAGSPIRAQVLISKSRMHNLLAAQTSEQMHAAEAANTAVEALRASTQSGEVHAAVYVLVTVFSLMLSRGQYQGPFQDAEDALRTALAKYDADDWALRVGVLTAIGAATAMDATVSGDEAARAASWRALADAERALPAPEPTSRWYASARILFTWTAVQGLSGREAESVSRALRLLDLLEIVLASNPEVAEPAAGPGAGQTAIDTPPELEGLRQVRAELAAVRDQRASQLGAPETVASAPESSADARGTTGVVPSTGDARVAARRGLDKAAAVLGASRPDVPRPPLDADRRPEPEQLRSVAAALHSALAGVAEDARLRRQVDLALGICHAELYWADPAARTQQTLREAVSHLNRALTADDHALPSAEWAGLLDVLARCLREVSLRYNDAQPPSTAERTVRAALRELARCVMIAEGTEQAQDVAAAANEIVARAVGWSLADNQPRAAVDIAEAGRGLVLASVVLSGRVEAVLRGAGNHDAAEAWRSKSETGRAAALNALRDTAAGDSLLSTPIGEEISVTLIGTPFDAVVYLTPPARPDFADADAEGTAADNTESTGHAMLVRPMLGQVEVVPLPGLDALGSGTPLDAYLAALEGALTRRDPRAGDDEGFRGEPAGQAWAGELEKLGRWTYATIIAPLLEHIRGWSLDHLPHLAFVPLGQLTAIPLAASWTDDTPDGGRRYAIDDTVISYAASARLLGEVARRPRRPLSERVVLVSDPGGEFPMTRRVTRQLARRQYPGAEVYGLKSDRNGPATASALLGALPAADRPGASLLQLSTHGTITPTPRLQTKDGWLPLSSVLDQARDRPPDAPGGLVITNACLTDTSQGHYDESLTMATAFLAAGATAVVGTRWPVDDDTAAAMSLRLHYHLQFGYQPAEALRRAQLDLLRPTASLRAALGQHLGALSDARLSHLATWAGHVHHGI
jgi:CHAT domain-containing protein